MHGRAAGDDGGSECVLAIEDVGDLVVEVLGVSVGHHIGKKSFGTTRSEALDGEQYSDSGR
jgi:hypothetical protein